MILRVWQSLACRSPRHLVVAHRVGRLLWWTVTLQLPGRLRLWRQARRARNAAGSAPRAFPVSDPVPSAGQIVLPRHPQPLVSIVIPTYGQVSATLCCLAAIAADPPAAAIEVVVVDDASPDPEVVQLARVTGIRLIRPPRNLGFLHSCNDAAQWAVGEYLLFLNNDTLPCPGWLDAMVDLLRTRPDAGAVGAKLLYPDGRLQEAGGIVWNDASGWNYGRGGDPTAPDCNYVREVDYCSGAALMVRRALFARLGGFDPCYAPAYFEDSDLAFRLRAIGFATLYQPRAEVVHIEGLSHGTDITQGVKAHQAINRDTFIARWADLLASQHVAPGAQVLRARDRAFDRQVVLVIDHRAPEPDRDAGSCTMRAFVDALRSAGAVVKFWADCPPQPIYDVALQQSGVEVWHGDWIAFVHWIAANGVAMDHVLLSRPEVAERYLLPLRRYSRARISFYGHDLHHDRLRQQAAASGDKRLARAARTMLRRERRVWRQADAVLYPSQDEADRVSALEPRVIARAVQPYALEAVATPRAPDRTDLVLFVAGFAHPPNEEAACWLARDIMPLVRRQVPSARLAIVGSHPTARVSALAGHHVTIAADVSETDLRAWYARARVAVVPLRQGAGVKRKVVEALAEGLPLVTTPIGAQGLPDLDRVALVCSTSDAIADAMMTLLRDDRLWRAHSSAGIAYVREHFSAAGLRNSLLHAMALKHVSYRSPEGVTRRPSTVMPGAGPASTPCGAGPKQAVDAVAQPRHDVVATTGDRIGPLVPGQGPGASPPADQVPLPPEPAQHRQPLLQIGNQVVHVLQPDMQPHQRPLEPLAGGAGDKPGGRQSETLEPAPGGADAEQRQRLDKRVRALD